MASLTENETEIKNLIRDSAQKLFFIHGFTKVTMDEIASKIGISKKTIYKHYPGKAELIREITEKILAEVEDGMREIVQASNVDFSGKFQKMLTFVGIHLSKLNRTILEDIKQNAPQLWKKISECRVKSIYVNFGKLMREGRQKGMFRSDIDEQLVLLIYSNIVENTINPEILSQLPLSATQVYEAIVKVVFEGILSEEARIQFKNSRKIN